MPLVPDSTAPKLYHDTQSLTLAERYSALFALAPLAPAPVSSGPPPAAPTTNALDRRGVASLPGHAPGAALFALAGRLRLGAGTGLVPQCVAPGDVLRRASLRSDLARACGLNKHRALEIVDACAGWGVDGLSLAASGARVTLLEQHPVIWALLDDLLRQHSWGVTNLQLADARPYLLEGGGRWDVVYLDPMFPKRTKTALPNQRLQLISQLAMPPQGLEDWLKLALSAARRRVVLKRRRKDPVLLEPLKPTWQIQGKTVRYDVYAAA